MGAHAVTALQMNTLFRSNELPTSSHFPTSLSRNIYEYLRSIALNIKVMQYSSHKCHITVKYIFLSFVIACIRTLTSFVKARDEARIKVAGNKFFIPHDVSEKRKRRLNAINCVFVKRCSQTINCRGSVATPNGEFRNQWIVID